MIITQDEVVDLQTVLHVELEEEDLAPYLDRGYNKVSNHVDVPGFRRGKAPRTILERFVGRETLLNEALEFMLIDVTQRAISTQELEVAGSPRIKLVDRDPVKVEATVALTPKVDLGAYRDIGIEVEDVKVTEEEVQQRLAQMQREQASWEPVERPVKLGDQVSISVVGTVEGSDILNEEDAVIEIKEDSPQLFPGLAAKLEGVETNVLTEFTLAVPEDYSDTRLRGKEAHFSVTVTDVKEQVLPELDDEFAKGVKGDHESLAELREAITEEIESEAKKARDQQYREASLEALLGMATVELPPLLVEQEVENMRDRRDRLVSTLNMRLDDYLSYTGKTEEQSREEMEKSAVEQLTRSYTLNKLAELEGLEVLDEEIDRRLLELEGPDDRQRNRRRRRRDSVQENQRAVIRESMLVTKALDRLTEIAKSETPKTEGEVQDSNPKEEEMAEGGDTIDPEA